MPTKDTSRDSLLRESYAAAEKRLRLAHPDEFNTYRQEEAHERGVEWTPPKSKTDKARDTLDAIFAEHPELLAEVRKESDSAPTVADLPDLPPED